MEVSLPTPGERTKGSKRKTGLRGSGIETGKTWAGCGGWWRSYVIGMAEKSVVKSRKEGSPSSSKVKGVSTQPLSIAPA